MRARQLQAETPSGNVPNYSTAKDFRKFECTQNELSIFAVNLAGRFLKTSAHRNRPAGPLVGGPYTIEDNLIYIRGTTINGHWLPTNNDSEQISVKTRLDKFKLKTVFVCE